MAVRIPSVGPGIAEEMPPSRRSEVDLRAWTVFRVAHQNGRLGQSDFYAVDARRAAVRTREPPTVLWRVSAHVALLELTSSNNARNSNRVRTGDRSLVAGNGIV